MSAYGFHNFNCRFVKEIQNEVFACFYEIVVAYPSAPAGFPAVNVT
jgi:hypothetical protein